MTILAPNGPFLAGGCGEGTGRGLWGWKGTRGTLSPPSWQDIVLVEPGLLCPQRLSQPIPVFIRASW